MKTINTKNINSNAKTLYYMVKKSFTQELKLPIIDVEKYLKKSNGWEAECKLVADCLHETGILCIKDPVSKVILITIL